MQKCTHLSGLKKKIALILDLDSLISENSVKKWSKNKPYQVCVCYSFWALIWGQSGEGERRPSLNLQRTTRVQVSFTCFPACKDSICLQKSTWGFRVFLYKNKGCLGWVCNPVTFATQFPSFVLAKGETWSPLVLKDLQADNGVQAAPRT